MHAVILRRALDARSNASGRIARFDRRAAYSRQIPADYSLSSALGVETTSKRGERGWAGRWRERENIAARERVQRSVFSPTETFHRLCNTVTAYSVASPRRTANCQMPLRIESEQSFCRRRNGSARPPALSECRINARHPVILSRVAVKIVRLNPLSRSWFVSTGIARKGSLSLVTRDSRKRK